MEKLSIVVPTYNEAGNIENLAQRLKKVLKGIDYEIIFVDDSTDDTPEVLEKASAADHRIRYEHRTKEKGLATAVLRGFELAEGEILACMDADLQHPPEILRPMYAAVISGFDFCVPSRFIPGGSDGGLDPWRKFVSWTARWIGKLALPCLRKISDPTGGLFMFRKAAIEKADMQPVGWKIMIEVLAMADYSSVVEIPYSFQDRTSGESKLSGKVTLQYLQQVKGLMFRAANHGGATVTRWTVTRTKAAVRDLLD